MYVDDSLSFKMCCFYYQKRETLKWCSVNANLKFLSVIGFFINVFSEMLHYFFIFFRQFIKSAIISIIKNSKKRVKSKARKNHKNRPRCVSSTADCLKIRTFIFSQVNDSCSTRARVAHTILVKAYKKGLWRDDKVANVLADCVFNKLQTIQVCFLSKSVFSNI